MTDGRQRAGQETCIRISSTLRLSSRQERAGEYIRRRRSVREDDT